MGPMDDGGMGGAMDPRDAMMEGMAQSPSHSCPECGAPLLSDGTCAECGAVAGGGMGGDMGGLPDQVGGGGMPDDELMAALGGQGMGGIPPDGAMAPPGMEDTSGAGGDEAQLAQLVAILKLLQGGEGQPGIGGPPMGPGGPMMTGPPAGGMMGPAARPGMGGGNPILAALGGR